MSDRRYDEKEVAEIFRSASEGVSAPQRSASGEEGLTLADLQSIGRQVGIAPQAVAQAAGALDVRRSSPQRKFLGLPIGVSRTVELNKRLSDEEWERLVVQLREVFDAHGRSYSEGSLRRWSNGNLQAILEPTDTGQRLRLRTVNGRAQSSLAMGLGMLGTAVATSIPMVIRGGLVHAGSGIATIGVIGVGLIAGTVVRLPRWARLRANQMEAIGARLATAPALPDPLEAPSATE